MRALVWLALAGCQAGGFAVDSLDPAVASSLSPTPITVHGRGFYGVARTSVDNQAMPAVDERFTLSVGTLDLGEVERSDERTLRAVVPAGLPPGRYEVRVHSPDGRVAAVPGGLVIPTPPLLSAVATLTASPLVGQRVRFTLTVSNAGETDALALTPGVPELAGPAAVGDYQPPAAVDVPAGGSAQLGFSWLALGAGDLLVRAGASAHDPGGAPLDVEPVAATGAIVSPPALTLAATAGGTVSVGQRFPITLEIENTGQSPALAVAPSLTVSGSGALVVEAAPPAADVPPGITRFVWSCRATQAGSVAFELAASGLDTAGQPATASPIGAGPLTILDAPLLGATLAAAPATVSTGQLFAVTMTVVNSGGVTAGSVLPAPPVSAGSGGATLVGSPAPCDLPPGAGADFTWSFRAGGAGTLSFSGVASGVDPGSGGTLSSAPATANPVWVQSAAQLVGSLAVAPPQLTQGQLFTITLTVENRGQAAALAVTPQTPLAAVPGHATLISSPGPDDLAGGALRMFTWTFQAVAPGVTVFTGSASGSDANSGAAAVTGSVSSGPLTVQSPPLLGATLAVPATVYEGQIFPVTLNVSNAGGAAANTTPALTVSPGATFVDGPSPSQAQIGAAQAFVWHYRADTPGSLTFTGSAAGVDVNSGAAVACGSAQASLTVQQHAALTATLTAPASVTSGQSFIVHLNVTDSGGDSAVNLVPSALVVGGTASASLVSGPTPVGFAGPLAPLGTAVFSYTYAASGSGTLVFTGSASGADAADALAITSPPASSPSILVGNPALLGVSVGLPPRVTRGSDFTVRVTVTDLGGAGANNVTVAAPTVSGGATLKSGPSPASASLVAGSSTTFVFTYTATSDGPVTLAGTASGVDATGGEPVSQSFIASTTVGEVEVLLSNPFGDGTSAFFVFAYNGRIHLGPKKDGAGALRANPDGSGAEPIVFSFPYDGTGNRMANTATPPYRSFGASGCAANTLACGPDDESGRGLYATGTVGGVPWVIGSGSAPSVGSHYVYMSSDSGTTMTFPFVDLTALQSGTMRTLTAVDVFHDHVWLGFRFVNELQIVELLKSPSLPGLNAVKGVDALQLKFNSSPLGASGAMFDVITDFNDRLYLANANGCLVSRNNDPGAWADGDWTSCEPARVNTTLLPAVVTAKTSDLEPADRAWPAMTAFGGRFYAARNSQVGPQLLYCDPSLTGDAASCDPWDWLPALSNSQGNGALSQLNDPGNSALTLLLATSRHLYVGFNNGAGVQLYRSRTATPFWRGDFEGLDGCTADLHPVSCAPFGGSGLGGGATRIFDSVAATFAGRDHLYIVAGDGSGAAAVYHIAE